MLFGSGPKVVSNERALQSTSFFGTLKEAVWSGNGGGTYLWHMIQEDIKDTYRPKGGKLRVFVFTDGIDCESPSEYVGINGMNPMMEELKKEGYDIEFFITIVGDDVSSSDLQQYRDLALATGGAIQHLEAGTSLLNWAFNVPSPRYDDSNAKSFVNAISSCREKRISRQQEYQKLIDSGQTSRFKWF